MNNFVNKHIRWVFVLPTFLFMVVMLAVPILMTFAFSLNDWNLLMGTGMSFNFGKNYLEVLASKEFWQSLGVTFYYTVLSTLAEMLLGLSIALVLNKRFRGKNVVKTIVLLPYMMAPVAVGLMWMLFYEPSSGLLNYVFTSVGLPRSSFVSAKQTVIPAIAAVETWQMTPMVVIVCLAGLSSLPTDPMEAARVDGATPVQTFFQVTLPLLTQTLFSIGLLRFIDVFKSFDLIYAMTKGGPANASRTLNLFAYETAFSYYKFGLSSTMLMLLFVIVLLLSVVVMKFQRKLVEYYGG
ncbi:carbohydrate ABC transporter permease [Lacrimispora celerecrescens]|uniref:Multiple sugar transport system permease protein n=1 Tax=[Clostridium] celerecrescens 18A TaxID=1286362 RepID=A0A2M8Z228_9FIRM|nr:sugar ABC transporter permease [Lacrimispora celerecrescens]PJJ27492.1 multiple sugar transport system permease protein [[Clostridium] celerecrescens 18A]